MKYSRFIPKICLQHIVEYYWIVEGENMSVQKIIPDGCPELIFHFGDPYKISSATIQEKLQSSVLIAGQLDQPIFLRPTGQSGVLGVKFKAIGLWKLFGCDMHVLTNNAYSLNDVLGIRVDGLVERIASSRTNDHRIKIIETFLLKRLVDFERKSELDNVADDIRKKNGQISIRALSASHKLSGRKIERLFLQQVGTSPKVYARIVRFTSVFNLLQQPSVSKVEASYLSGYFDQAHFNNEFRSFTGENPESYFKQHHTFSNFFLNR
jgi:AraC-like DNA-binding protein